MKSKVLGLVLALAFASPAICVDPVGPVNELAPLHYQGRAARVAAMTIERYHYKNLPLDDALSGRIFDLYLKQLDPEKLFFTQADIDAWSQARNKLDDAIASENLALPFALFNFHTQRAIERFTYARSLLQQDFDFQSDETLPYERSKAPWPQSEEEVKDLWRRRVKNDWLQLKLSGKSQKTIIETLDRRYDSFIKRLSRQKSEDAFQAFMNAYTMAVEPHTNYLGKKASENFDISMKLSLVGIGAVLEEKDGYPTIKELVPGSPAALSKQLQAGDRIIRVSQGEPETMTDVVGWGLEDTVSLIRGAPDSTVILDILPDSDGQDGTEKRVTLVRKKVSLEQQAAKKSIVTIRDGDAVRPIGVIKLPTFYEDFGARLKGDADYKSAARDVDRIIKELKSDKVAGLIIDLRDNVGGSLREAVELTGLFIDKGPVVQERDARGQIVVEEDTDGGAAWEGPLAVLINRSSASASEIFAAAIQDYGRGVIIGEPSYGKGTVQNMFHLDPAKSQKQEYGDLKLTIAQFFRINGGTTQLKGVMPDIPFPTISDASRIGESSLDNPLPWIQIPPAPYKRNDNLLSLFPILQAYHEMRMEKDPDFRQLRNDINELNERRKERVISLNETKRRLDREKTQARLVALRKLQREETITGEPAAQSDKAETGPNTPPDKELQSELDAPIDALVLGKARKGARDLLLIEAAHIVSDQINLLEKDAVLASGSKHEGQQATLQ